LGGCRRLRFVLRKQPRDPHPLAGRRHKSLSGDWSVLVSAPNGPGGPSIPFIDLQHTIH